LVSLLLTILAQTLFLGTGVGSASANESRVLCDISDPRLTEISGMTASALHADVMWVHNDSGDVARLYALSLKTCDVVGELTLRNVDARDFEGIARGVDQQGRAVLWVGDIGDNLDSWESVALYRVREPQTLGVRSVRATKFRFTYEDRPHNAETIVADPKSPQLWIVTKQLASGGIYQLPARLSKSRINIAERVGGVGGLVTDGSMNPKGTGFVLRDYFDAHLYTGLPPGAATEKFPLPAQIQGEAIAYTATGDALVVASEKDTRLIQIDVPNVDSPKIESPKVDSPTVGEQPVPPEEETPNYVPLVIGIVGGIVGGIGGGIALLTGLISISRRPSKRTTGNTKKAK
jgi:hypothetical protein